ncbi:MAG: hypothetical protein NT092_12585, partial [Bacteroidia bacterium]|nr:hypothetical protein [Bacteroidia bacterium]
MAALALSLTLHSFSDGAAKAGSLFLYLPLSRNLRFATISLSFFSPLHRCTAVPLSHCAYKYKYP